MSDDTLKIVENMFHAWEEYFFEEDMHPYKGSIDQGSK